MLRLFDVGTKLWEICNVRNSDIMQERVQKQEKECNGAVSLRDHLNCSAKLFKNLFVVMTGVLINGWVTMNNLIGLAQNDRFH